MLVAQRNELPAVGNNFRSQQRLSVVVSGSNVTAEMTAYSAISGIFRDRGTADHEPETENARRS
jgi:hypothetical protein